MQTWCLQANRRLKKGEKEKERKEGKKKKRDGDDLLRAYIECRDATTYTSRRSLKKGENIGLLDVYIAASENTGHTHTHTHTHA